MGTLERNIVREQTARAEYPWILRPRCAVCLTAGALKRVVHTVRSEGDGQEIVAAIDDGGATRAEGVGADGGNGRNRGRGDGDVHGRPSCAARSASRARVRVTMSESEPSVLTRAALVLRSDLTMRPRYARPGHETADGLLPPLLRRCSLRAANRGRQIPRTRGRVRAPKRGGSTAFLPIAGHCICCPFQGGSSRRR